MNTAETKVYHCTFCNVDFTKEGSHDNCGSEFGLNKVVIAEEKTMSYFDKACFILKKTHDGNDLAPEHLRLVEIIVNGHASESGEVAFEQLYQSVIAGYSKPWFCGIENLTRDHEGFVYWKGIQVEHYDHDVFGNDGWQAKMKKDAEELAQRCRFLESKNIKVNTTNAIWKWDEIKKVHG